MGKGVDSSVKWDDDGKGSGKEDTGLAVARRVSDESGSLTPTTLSSIFQFKTEPKPDQTNKHSNLSTDKSITSRRRGGLENGSPRFESGIWNSITSNLLD
jgi:hypothetical protein